MKRSFFLTLSVMLLFSCHKNANGKLEQKIQEEIMAGCKNDNCTVDLSEITSFKWSKFYVFKETASREMVERNLNQSYPYFDDMARRLIFLDESNKIVYHEDIFPHVNGVANNDVIFDMPDTVSFRVYTNPKFSVTKEKLEKGYYYLLNQ